MYFSARAEGRISYGHLGRTNLFCDSLLLTERFEMSFYYYLLLLLLLLFDFSIVILMRLTVNLQLNSYVGFACVKSYS